MVSLLSDNETVHELVWDTLRGLRCRTRVSVARYDALTESVPVMVYDAEVDCTSVRVSGVMVAERVSVEVNQLEKEIVRVLVMDSWSVSVCE